MSDAVRRSTRQKSPSVRFRDAYTMLQKKTAPKPTQGQGPAPSMNPVVTLAPLPQGGTNTNPSNLISNQGQSINPSSQGSATTSTTNVTSQTQGGSNAPNQNAQTQGGSTPTNAPATSGTNVPGAPAHTQQTVDPVDIKFIKNSVQTIFSHLYIGDFADNNEARKAIQEKLKTEAIELQKLVHGALNLGDTEKHQAQELLLALTLLGSIDEEKICSSWGAIRPGFKDTMGIKAPKFHEKRNEKRKIGPCSHNPRAKLQRVLEDFEDKESESDNEDEKQSFLPSNFFEVGRGPELALGSKPFMEYFNVSMKNGMTPFSGDPKEEQTLLNLWSCFSKIHEAPLDQVPIQAKMEALYMCLKGEAQTHLFPYQHTTNKESYLAGLRVLFSLYGDKSVERMKLIKQLRTLRPENQGAKAEASYITKAYGLGLRLCHVGMTMQEAGTLAWEEVQLQISNQLKDYQLIATGKNSKIRKRFPMSRLLQLQELAARRARRHNHSYED